MEIRNRIALAPMGTHLATEDGYVSQAMIDYYEERARGGAGLIVVEATPVDARGVNARHRAGLYDDRSLSGWKDLTEAIKHHGARAAVELCHAGRTARSLLTGPEPVAPSAHRAPVPLGSRERPPFVHETWPAARELTVEEIHDIVVRFGEAAARARSAGFDAVEVHACHHFLVAEFLSRAWNERTDAYGGELNNRARFLLEIIRAIKKAAGQDFTVMCRINAIEYCEGGITLDEAKEVARMVQDAGADSVEPSAYGYGNDVTIETPRSVGPQLPWAAEIKKAVSIPVVAVGRITPEAGERALREGKADFIYMGRALICDPELPNKLLAERHDEIRPCIACYHCLTRPPEPVLQFRCSVNAALAREREYRIMPTVKPKKVLVVGGGPGGMEAARVAAQRGHHVILCEKENRLGGQMVLAAVPPGKKDLIEPFTSYLIGQVKKLGVELHLCEEVTPAMVEAIGPDAVILATGATPYVPDIPGVDRPNVVLANDVLNGKKEVGDRVVVLGGDLVGCEAADYLAEKGRPVTITRRGQEMATGVPSRHRIDLLTRLAAKSVAMLTRVKYEVITDRGLAIVDAAGQSKIIAADTIVLAAGARPNTELAEALQGKEYKTYRIGDCVEPRSILEAVHDGARVGRAI